MKIGETISELREECGLKQKQVAALLNVAVSTISNYENDKYEMNLEQICAMADLYDVSTDYILGRTSIRNCSICRKEKIHGIISKEKVVRMAEFLSIDDFRCIIRLLYIAYRYRMLEKDYKTVE